MLVASARKAPVIFNDKAERTRRRLLKPLSFWLYQWWKLPLAACAGLSLSRLDERGCDVALPGGWRTQNPFRSTYFAALAMAAEMSTGAPALVLVDGAPASVSMLVREMHASFVKKGVGRLVFSFDDVAGMAASVEKAAQGKEPETFVARSVGRMGDGTVVAEFNVTWTFKRRA
jgi:hypothetical protein